MTLPFAISFAMTSDIALNAAAAVFGLQHFTLAPSPIGQFGALVAAGILVHEIIAGAGRGGRAVGRWWLRRQERRAKARKQSEAQAGGTPRK